MTTETVIETMVERIVARFQPARILLFGSRARGTAIAGATSTCSSSWKR